MKRKTEHVLLSRVYTNFEDWKVEEQQKEMRMQKQAREKDWWLLC